MAKAINKELPAKVEQRIVSLKDKYVFMDKAIAALDVGLKTEKNVVLYGPGGHGKSELTLDYFLEKGIQPYVITFGSGMTADRLLGGFDIKTYDETGKFEYLVKNSFMNHEYVIFEEMMDGQDFILEILKDILSSGYFRNGTQVFEIKTKFIVACTNKTREEFAKNASLKALMERFPLEYNVIWDNYTEASYTTLLKSRFDEDMLDPVIPFLLQEYSKNGIIISPRIALDCFEIFMESGPDALMFIADLAKKPHFIADAIKKFEESIKFRELAGNIEETINAIANNTNRTTANKKTFMEDYQKLQTKLTEVRKVTVGDEMIQTHAAIVAKLMSVISDNHGRFTNCVTAMKTANIREKAGYTEPDSDGFVEALNSENIH